MDFYPLLKRSNEKNALRRYVWMQRLALVSLMGALSFAVIALLAPLFQLAKWIALLGGAALGAALRGKRDSRDPAMQTALGEGTALLGSVLLLWPPIWLVMLALFLIGMGLAKAMIALHDLSGYLGALCSYLMKKAQKRTRLTFAVCFGILDAALGVLLFRLFPSKLLCVTLLFLAALSALRFPLSRTHLDRLPAPGETALPAIDKQLAPFVFLKRKRRHFLFLIRRVIRIAIPGKVYGQQNMPPETQKGVVCLCNHGYVQGTILSRAWFDRAFRSWSLSDLIDKQDAYPHIRKYQVDVWAWVRPWFREPLTHILVHLFAWLFDSIDSIPVYRNHLRKLMDTFRQTVDALECGDLVVIYPENPDDPSLQTPGYLTEGIGPLYTGFTLIGSLYHQRTGESVTYVPMYCSKNKRILAIGTPIASDPQNIPAVEKERIVHQAREAMLKLMAEVEGAGASVPVPL